jgi:hypothetical protein
MAYEPEFPVLTTYTDLYKDNSTKAQGSTEWKNFYGVDPVTPKLDVGTSTERYNIHQSYPYGGMIRFTSTYNSRAKDCNLSGRTVYYEAKTTSSTPIAMGSYDLHIFGSTHVYIENVNQLNDINDAHYWGIMNSTARRTSSSPTRAYRDLTRTRASGTEDSSTANSEGPSTLSAAVTSI